MLNRKPMALSEVMAMLEQRSESGDFNYTQRVALDHATKFSRLSLEQTNQLFTKLQDDFELDLDSSVQICNIIPETIEELRIVMSEQFTDLDDSKLEAILEYIIQVVA